MKKGSIVRLNTSTMGLESINGQRIANMIPAGALIRILPESAAKDNMVDVLYEGRILSLFAIDLEERGELFKSVSTTSR